MDKPTNRKDKIVENVNNRLQDMRDALEEIQEVEKRLNLNGEISNAVQGIIIDATNMFNKEIDKIVSEAEDIQEELCRAKEYLENNPETALVSISRAYKKVTNIALTEKIRDDGARYIITPEKKEESEKSQIDQILDDLAENLEVIGAIASHAPEDKKKSLTDVHQDASDCIAALPGWIEAEIKKAKSQEQ
jgi:hypothetical protein